MPVLGPRRAVASPILAQRQGASVSTWCHPVYMAQSSSTAPAQVPNQPCEITAVTRRDVFDFLRAENEPWWGRLSEIGFLGKLYDLDALPSDDPRHSTAAGDITQHRFANFDWADDWVFEDPRFRLTDGPDHVLLAFLCQMAHPLVRPDTEQAVRLVTRLNSLLTPDGWELRTNGFISGRPVYAPVRTADGPGRMIRMRIEDNDAGKLDLVLGQVHCMLGENGDVLAQGLIVRADLTVRRDGGIFYPVPGDNWNAFVSVGTVPEPMSCPGRTLLSETRALGWGGGSAGFRRAGSLVCLSYLVRRDQGWSCAASCGGGGRGCRHGCLPQRRRRPQWLRRLLAGGSA
jgi:hypothetical protein